MTVACILWNLDVPTRLGVAFLTEQYMAFQLALTFVLLVCIFDKHGQDKFTVSPLDWLIAAVGFAVLMYAAVNYDDLLAEQAYRPPAITLIGIVVVLFVLEGVRRRAGWPLFGIVAVFLLYALFADKVPGALIGKELSPVRLVQYIGFDASAVFSTPLAVGTTVVILFVFFGKLLFAAGGGTFFTDIAMAATGRTRGGGAKISVVASALFGSISGSAVSNVVTTGVLTIPLMRRGGYSKVNAGAIEAIASTGGQLTPPIMGAAAFLMAEFLEISYLNVAAAALLPAILYYASVFIQVDLIAGRDNIATVDEDLESVGTVLARGWHFLLPMLVLLLALFWFRFDPEGSALCASLTIVVIGFIRGYKTTRLTLKKLFDVFVETAYSVVDLILIVAAAGFVIGVLNATGLGFALTLLLVDSVGQNLVILLLSSAVICILLGMGMPTSGVYVLLAALIAPSLVEIGIEPLAAHLFILYFGMMSMLTPPVALAAFAASAITRASPFATGVASMRIGWAAYVIPFVFVSSPVLLMQGDGLSILVAFLKTLTGVVSISVAIVGYFSGRRSMLLRCMFAVLGIGSMPIALWPVNPVLEWQTISSICALAVVAALILIRVFALRDPVRSAPSSTAIHMEEKQ